MSLAEPETTSRRGSINALSKLRRKKTPNNVSTNSLTTSSTDGDDALQQSPNLRASMDATVDSGKESPRRSFDGRAGGEGASRSRLGSFVSRKKRDAQKQLAKALDAPRNGSMSADPGHTTAAIPGNRSDSSLLLDESGRSSLLTDDSSDNEGKPTRPSLSTHPSHTGYLTLSSPEINAKTQSVVSIPQIIEPPSDDPQPSPTQKADTAALGALRGLFRPSSRRGSVDSRRTGDSPQAEENPEARQQEEQAERIGEQPGTPKARATPIVSTTSLPATPPNLVETPTTLVTPPTPTEYPSAEFPRSTGSPSKRGSPHKLSSVESIKHRRAQSANLPSKLSTSITAPLTPTVEETKTPGGTLTQPTNATGFFTSFFSGAQKAADQFSNSINTSILPSQKKPPSSQSNNLPSDVEVVPGVKSKADSGGIEGGDSKRPLALETLGQGNLSLSHLGIEAPTPTDTMSSSNLPHDAQSQSRKTEEAAAARAVSSAYEQPVAAVVSQATGRPPSIVSNDRLTLQSDQSPPTTVVDGDIKRSGSVRSKLSGRHRKHRASSATAGTHNSIAAGIKDSTLSLANPGANGTGHRLTGFAVASSKRNKDFHSFFRSVPEDDYLIEDYSAALQRDILLHGRLYVSEGHICFSSNILGWVTTLVISFDEVVSVEKKSTAMIFPNAIVISTLQARNTFASFVARDSTYELLIGIWKISHPNLKSSLNGVMLDDAGTGDKTEVAEPEGSDEQTSENTEDEVYDEDDDDEVGSFTDAGVAPSITGSEIGDSIISRKVSAVPPPAPPLANGFAAKAPDGADPLASGADFPGAAAHGPTECSDVLEHYDRPLTDTTIPAPLGKVYSLMFGAASGTFMRKWLVEDQKSRELNFTDDKTGLDNDHKIFVFDYIKPLNAPVGPRQTKCITTMNLTAFDLDKAISIDCSTQTPDVPSGNVFTTKTRYCLMWGPANSTRFVATCTIEWTGKSWLKGPIEKGANDGQIEYVKSLVAALKASLVTKAPAKAVLRKGGRRKGKREATEVDDTAGQREAAIAAAQQKANWGFLEPLHQILGACSDIVRPFVTSQVVIAVLFVLLVYTWISPPRGSSAGVAFPGYSSPDRVAAYEEIWRREESSLWDWLEDRAGVTAGRVLTSSSDAQQEVLGARGMRKAVEEERMTVRQMDEAIRTTEERLAALKEAVQRRKREKKET